VKLFLLVLLVTLLAVTVLVPSAIFPARASAKDSAEILKQLEADFMKAAAEHGSQGYMSYYAADAVELPNGADAIPGKSNIAKTMGFLDDKNNHLTWTPVGADMSSSGDLGYTYGTYEFRSEGKDGKPVVSHGKYTSIWKKQRDGAGKWCWTWAIPTPKQNNFAETGAIDQIIFGSDFLWIPPALGLRPTKERLHPLA
jgi:ketosteroid isomerase-like protein